MRGDRGHTEAHRKERAEWQDVQLYDRPAQEAAAAAQTPSLAVRPRPMPVDHQPLALRAAHQPPELEAHTTATGDGGHHAPPADVAGFGGSWNDFLPTDDLNITQTDYSAFGFSSAPSPLASFLFPPDS